MSQHTNSSTKRHASLHAETDQFVCEEFMQLIRQNEHVDIDELLAGIDEPRRTRLAIQLQLCRDGYQRSQVEATEETLDPTHDDELAADVSHDFDTIEQLGRYRIQRLLGRGAFGQVLLARDEQLDRLVAIKTPRSDQIGGVRDIQKFQNEAKILARLDHPAIVPVYDVGITSEHRCFVVSKFIDGTDLAARIRLELPSIAQAARWLTAIAEALHHAHSRRLVHRDVKPGNILLDSEDRPYLADFGLALRDEDYGRGSHFAGTVQYMSPEQARGEGHLVDGRSDIFSLGVVLYMLLTGERPFSGVDKKEVLQRIARDDVRPPRQHNDRVPKELERICLRALEKRASDRYTTARDMAEDLRHFLHEYEELVGATMRGPLPSDGDSLTSIHPVMPKGLRSFDADDAEFFLSLLPGPYDRLGVPQAVRFWKRQIERSAAGSSFRVGLVYGPSGCGKSSLVQAGILPNLTPDIRTVLLEATADDTEQILLSRLHGRCPEVDTQKDLPSALAEIRTGGGLPEGEQLLIVVDQFEQWLHAHQRYDETRLFEALRQCDGQRVQCLLLVRDDFWMSATRFMHALEVRIVEGENSMAVDLFDIRHARKVLAAFGRAYGALPARSSETTAEQKRFLDQALEELAHEGKIIPVQLVLFSEMVKHKSWTPETLRTVGGIQGIGVTFLEEAFASATAVPEHRLRQREARAVLAALLPEHGSDIKGHTRSRDELFAASTCAAPQDFDALLEILNAELRLLTPVEASRDAAAADSELGAKQYFQLTHDYLVPAIRQWLTRKQRETRQGRAQLLLAERAEFWHTKPERKQLPSFPEWLSIQRYVRRRERNETQRKMMAAATRMYVRRTALVAVALCLLGWVGVQVYQYQRASQLVADLLVADVSAIPDVIRQMQPYRNWVDGLLQDVQAGDDSRKELAVRLASRPLENADAEWLVEYLLGAAPGDAGVIRDTLLLEAPDRQPLARSLWESLEDTDQPSRQRLRAACALAALDPDSARWEANARRIAEWLVSETPVFFAGWVDLLEPVQGHLLSPLQQLYREGLDVQRAAAAAALVDYLGRDVEELVELNRDSDPTQRRVLAEELREHPDRQRAIALLERELERTVDAEADEGVRARTAHELTRAATMLMLLGEPDEVWPLLKQGPDPQIRTCLLHGIPDLDIEPKMLIEQLSAEQDPSLTIGLLLCLAKYDSAGLTEGDQEPLASLALELYRRHPDAGVHSACRCLLRRLDRVQDLAQLDLTFQRKDPPSDRDWYVTPHGHAMVVIRDPPSFLMGTPESATGWQQDEQQHEVTIGRSYAIGAMEVTYEQFRWMWEDYRERSVPDWYHDHPVGCLDVDTMEAFCLCLSEAEGMTVDECCYQRLDDGTHRPYPDFLERPGYRLPTEAEWEYAARAKTTTARHDGFGAEFVASFAWYRGVSEEGHTSSVGLLLPNDFGLFDVYGNAGEYCQNIYTLVPSEQYVPDEQHAQYTLRGGTCGSDVLDLRSAYRHGSGTGLEAYSFRIARTVIE